jgi:hypothetical protein
MRNTVISKLTFSENNTFRMYVMMASFAPSLVNLVHGFMICKIYTRMNRHIHRYKDWLKSPSVIVYKENRPII